VRKGSLEKAPEDILPNIEKRILDSVKPLKIKGPFTLFQPLFKPAFAGFFMLLVAVGFYTFLANQNIGYVENLSQRFKLAQFENIKSGDMLYAGDNTNADIRLNSKNKFQIHQIRLSGSKGPRRIALSRGKYRLCREIKRFGWKHLTDYYWHGIQIQRYRRSPNWKMVY